MNTDIRVRNLIIQYLVYIGLFVGTGFLSGAIVHYPINPGRYFIIGIVGAIIFVGSSTVNEAIFNKRNFKEEGIAKVIIFSLLLSLGIGMISGGVQHFDEFPVYASYLIPFGILLSLTAFILKNNIKLILSQSTKLSAVALPIVIALFFGLNTYAKTLPEGDHHGEETSEASTEMANHASMVKNDADFIMGMIPHHQEAVDTSKYILSKATRPEQKAFIQNIITVQEKEIATMKDWHRQWYGYEYKDDGKYENMMPDLEAYNSDNEALQAYFEGMMVHHIGAVQMAQQILLYTERPELEQFANAVITTQSEEIMTMRNWIKELKSLNPQQNEEDDEVLPPSHDDGHMSH